MIKLRVFAVIFNDNGEVLLLHRRDYDFWSLPGGYLSQGDVPWEALINKVEEGSGLKVKTKRLVGLYSKPDRHELIFSFACEKVGGALNPTGDFDQAKFFRIEDIPNNFPPKQMERITDALGDHKNLLLKTQKGPSAVDLFK